MLAGSCRAQPRAMAGAKSYRCACAFAAAGHIGVVRPLRLPPPIIYIYLLHHNNPYAMPVTDLTTAAPTARVHATLTMPLE